MIISYLIAYLREEPHEYGSCYEGRKYVYCVVQVSEIIDDWFSYVLDDSAEKRPDKGDDEGSPKTPQGLFLEYEKVRERNNESDDK
jgi:hypothetical protein